MEVMCIEGNVHIINSIINILMLKRELCKCSLAFLEFNKRERV